MHLLAIYFFKCDEFVNRTASLVSQLVGGLLILYSIDSNIGVIKQESLCFMLASYVKDFPLIKRSVTAEPKGVSTIGSTGRVVAGIDRNPQSIEEKIEHLQEQINKLKTDFVQKFKEVNEKIDQKSKIINTKVQNTKEELRNIESKVGKVSIGGLKVQLFGVLLIIYGAFSGYAA